MNITISTEILVAISLFRGIDDVRYYLNGIYLETGAKGARLVATDGHQLAVARLEGNYPEASIILPGSLVASIKSKPKAPQNVTLEFNEGTPQYLKNGECIPRNITLTFGDITAIGKEIDGKFPDYRRSVPSEVDGATAQFDPRLVSRIDKACNILGYKSFVGIAYNGDKAALSVINDNFVVATMAYRAEPSKVSPAWIQESLGQPVPERRAA